MFSILDKLEKWGKSMGWPKGSGARLPIEAFVLLMYLYLLHLAFKNNIKPDFDDLLYWTCYWLIISAVIIFIRWETVQQALIGLLSGIIEEIKKLTPK